MRTVQPSQMTTSAQPSSPQGYSAEHKWLPIIAEGSCRHGTDELSATYKSSGNSKTHLCDECDQRDQQTWRYKMAGVWMPAIFWVSFTVVLFNNIIPLDDIPATNTLRFFKHSPRMRYRTIWSLLQCELPVQGLGNLLRGTNWSPQTRCCCPPQPHSIPMCSIPCSLRIKARSKKGRVYGY